MKTKLLSMARRLWNNEMVDRGINRANQLKWARAVYTLGDKWLLANHIN